ncbi:MAG: TonB-dependent receptor [Gemmatimonadota bacterium]
MSAARRWYWWLVLVIGGALSPITAFGQTLVSGMIADAETGAAIQGAQVVAKGDAGVRRVESNYHGSFRLGLPAGRYVFSASFIGYAPWTDSTLRVEEGHPASFAIRLRKRPPELQPITIVARDDQSIIDAPAAVSVTHPGEQAQVALTPTDHLDHDPGMVIARKGLTQASFSARGPSAVNSAALLVLHDYRLASVPSLRLNVPYLIPTTDLDLDRIEVTRGPSAVIYGADADRGVVNFITRSPFEYQGTSVSLTGGGRSVFQGGFRHAQKLSDRVAFKVSGEYFEGDDWHTVDPREIRPRDEHIEHGAGETRVDWRVGDSTTVIVSGGVAQAINNVDLTEVGSIQVRDWRYSFGQVRMQSNRLFANLFLNQNDAGRTFQLYTGAPIVDDSRALSAQLQYGSRLGPKLDLTYGADVQRVVPRTAGTLHGRNEDRDNITMVGAYLSSTAMLSAAWSLVASLRGDHHNRLDDVALSPRVGVIFKPRESHAFRLTLNRATSTPVASDLFLDLLSSDNLNGLPFGVRVRGTAEPFTFRRDCNGGLCMRSPFVGNATAFIPLDATVTWGTVQNILLNSTAHIDITSIPQPTAQEVSTVLRVLNIGTRLFDPVSASEVRDIPAARRSFNSTFEAGYRGAIGTRYTLSADLYHSTLTNVLTPVSAQTPNAFLDEASLAAYLTSQGIPAPNAAAIAAIATGIPLGTVSPVQGDSTEILVIGRQGARLSFWGADFGISAQLNSHLMVDGTYSYSSKDLVPSAGGFSDIVFNAPRHIVSLGLGFRNPRSGVVAQVRGRGVSSFPVKSGEYKGEVEGYAVVDAAAQAQLPWNHRFTFSLSISNLLDHRHREFVGAPELGRLVLGKLQAEF